MLKRTSRSRFALAFILGLSLLCSSAFAQGDRNRTDRGSSSRGDVRGDLRKEDSQDNTQNIKQSHNRGYRYHYRDGRWYSRGWFGWEFAIASLTVGTMVESLPPRHTTVIVENMPYYYDDTVYYRQLPDGAYIVVAPPRGR
jgi:hypothetical protein